MDQILPTSKDAQKMSTADNGDAAVRNVQAGAADSLHLGAYGKPGTTLKPAADNLAQRACGTSSGVDAMLNGFSLGGFGAEAAPSTELSRTKAGNVLEIGDAAVNGVEGSISEVGTGLLHAFRSIVEAADQKPQTILSEIGNGLESAGKWAYHHPLEAAGVVAGVTAVVGIELATGFTATPELMEVGAQVIGANTLVTAGEHLYQRGELAKLYNSGTLSPEQRAEAEKQLGEDVGGAIVVTALVGTGAVVEDIAGGEEAAVGTANAAGQTQAAAASETEAREAEGAVTVASIAEAGHIVSKAIFAARMVGKANHFLDLGHSASDVPDLFPSVAAPAQQNPDREGHYVLQGF